MSALWSHRRGGGAGQGSGGRHRFRAQSVKQISFVATDNYRGGVLAARRLGAVLEGKGKASSFASRKCRRTDARETAFLDTIKNQFPGIQVISADQYSGGTYESAEKNATEFAPKTRQEANGIFASNEIGRVRMIAALRSTGLAKKIKFVGFDPARARSRRSRPATCRASSCKTRCKWVTSE